MAEQPTDDIIDQLEKLESRIKADPNRLSRDLSFEISCWNSLTSGVNVKYGDHDVRMSFVPNGELHLQLDGVVLVNKFPCDSASLDCVLRVENIGGVSSDWKIDTSILKHFRPYPIENDVIVFKGHATSYDMESERQLRAVLRFEGKHCPIQFYNYFCADGVVEAGVIVDVACLSPVITGIQFRYVEKDYLLYSCSDNSHDANYIVIESEEPVSWNTFSEVIRRILNVIGFFTGRFLYSPFLIFAICEDAKSELICYEDSLPSPCESIYVMTGMNPYWYFATADIHHKPSNNYGDSQTPESLRSRLKPFRRRHIEELMNLLDDKDFSLLFYTLIENSMSQHLRMATSRLIAYAVCLEIGGNWFKKQSVSKGSKADSAFLPAFVKEEVVSRLQKALDAYQDDLKASTSRDEGSDVTNVDAGCVDSNLIENLGIVRLRIGSELFKQTNAAKLAAQFTENGISLTKEDEKLLNGRNRILHGSDSIKVSFDPQDPEPYIEVSERKCFEYYALIWRLIMHIIGYDGLYCDVAGVQSSFRNHKSNEGTPFVREV